MTTVTVHDEPTPSAEIVKAARKTAEVQDSLGRTLKVRRIDALARIDLGLLLGAEASANGAVAGPCAVAFSVCEIDGEPIMRPATMSEMRLLIGRLDDAGLEAAAKAHVDHFNIAVDADAAKNS